MEFTFSNSRFLSPTFQTDIYFEKFITKYGFEDLLSSIVKGLSENKRNKIFSSLDVKSGENFIIAPYPMNREKIMSYVDFQKRYIDKITEYYKGSSATEMIFPCISEILLNFWEHATKDNQSILVAEGNKNKIEIACADTGEGILGTMIKGRPYLTKGKNDIEILELAMKKDITSKINTNHMGRGLWVLNEFAKKTNGTFYVFSQGVGLCTKFGRTTYFKSGFWPGSIIYINLPLNNIVTMNDVLREDLSLIPSIKLNLT